MKEQAASDAQAEGPAAEPATRHPDLTLSSNKTILQITVAALGIFLAALDQTVIVTALWPIATDLQVPVTEIDRAAWVVTAYLLGYTVALPLMGRVADVYGQRRIYLAALGIFTLGSVLCAVAPTLEWLVAARVVQAVGGGAVLPVGMAMASRVFTARRLPFMLGILAAVAEGGGVIGPLWGALVMNLNGLLDLAGWRWIFWINVPLGLLFGSLMLATPAMPRFPGKIDWAGAALLGAALLALSLGLSTPGSASALAGLDPQASPGGPQAGFSLTGLALVAASVLLLALFAWRQRRAASPLFPPLLFTRSNRPFLAANLTNLLVGAALIITMINVPLYVATVLDGSTVQGGLMLLRMTAFIPVGAIAGGILGTRMAYRWIALAGLLAAAGGFAQMTSWSVSSAEDPLTWLGLALNGLGFGLLLSPVTATALQWAGREQAALSAASVNLSRMVGMMVSLSLLTTLGLQHFQSRMAAHPAVIFANPGETTEAFTARQAEYEAIYKSVSLEVFSAGFLIAGAICVGGMLLAAMLRRNPTSDMTGPIF
ncbi:MAG TPA: MFS transporter [Chloroflexia bacterium]|nr:MFS transporter [Chloroflexia bacterium]